MNKLLIIYYEEFKHAAHVMKAIKDQGGVVHNTDLVSTKDIPKSSGNTGRLTDFDVKRFIKHRCEMHGNQPRWLLLLGDTEFIPTHYTGQMNIGNPSLENCGDIYFGQLDDQNANIPSIGIGRLPAKTVAEALDMVSKVGVYERMHNGSQSLDGFASTFTMINGAVGQNSETTLATVSGMVESNAYSVKSISAGSATINDMLSSVVVCYCGSGGRDGWHEPNFTLSQLSGLVSPTGPEFRLPFMVSISSESGFFDEDRYPMSTNGSQGNTRPWAEELVKLKNNGAIGIIGACRPTLEAENNTLMLGAFQALCPTTPGESPIKFLGDILNEGKRKVINSDASSDAKLQQITIYNLIGDPSLSLATQASVV